jgi:hypothetical protein
MNKKIIVVLVFVLASNLGIAQQRPKTGYWLTAQAPIQLAKRWNFFNEVGYRSLGNNLLPFQFFYRNTMLFVFNKHISAGLGTALFNTKTNFNNSEAEYTVEPRLYEELQANYVLNSNITIMGRLRVEQRFFQKTSVKPSFFSFRYRVRTSVATPITKVIAVQLHNEFMQANTNNLWAFDQNRLLTQLVFQLPINTQLQTGYQWIHYGDKSNQHIATVTVVKKINAWKQKS